MTLSEEQLRGLLDAPRETMDVELKSWIDPDTEEGIAKIAKGCMALRNNNGGVLVIGFRNDGKPDQNNVPSDVRAVFHVDRVQEIVGTFSSEPFPIDVQFGEKDRQIYPVISVPSGVRTPAVAKRNSGPALKPLIKDHAVYVRSLSSNNTVSSSEARRGDWERLLQLCFDNREADIGAFVRRHLSAINLDRLFPMLSHLSSASPPSAIHSANRFLDTGYKRFQDAMTERQLKIPDQGFREVAVFIDGEVPQLRPTQSLLDRLFVKQPQHTGWPARTDSRRFSIEADHPRVIDGGWQALLAESGYGLFKVPHLDFWRIDPAQGSYYLLTAFEDDLELPAPRPEPRTQLDFSLQLRRIAEIISVALSFARSMGCDQIKTTLVFAFRWTKLKGRKLSSWADRERTIHSTEPAIRDELTTNVIVPLDTPPSAIAPHVESATLDLFAVFGGMELESRLISTIVEDALQIRF
jgi:hypothetical protein